MPSKERERERERERRPQVQLVDSSPLQQLFLANPKKKEKENPRQSPTNDTDKKKQKHVKGANRKVY